MDNNVEPISSTASSSSLIRWVPFRSSILPLLSPGRYSLHQKPVITPAIPQTALCPPQDQFLFSEVDETERHLLDSAILTKLMIINRNGMKLVISDGDQVTGANGYFLHVFNNEWSGTAQVRLRKDLGGLMEMAYDKILMPVKGNCKPILIDLTEDDERHPDSTESLLISCKTAFSDN